MQQHSGYLCWPRVECIGFQTAITLSGLIARGRIKINKSTASEGSRGQISQYYKDARG